MLESAVYSTMQSFGEEDVYQTPPYEHAARLAHAITMNHPFCDGNKRIGMLAILMTVWMEYPSSKNHLLEVLVRVLRVQFYGT